MSRMLELNHQQLVKGVNCSFMRYLHHKIEWDDRLIGIFGSIGVGVTTLMLQHIKKTFGNDGRVLYLDMGNIWFKEHTLKEEAKAFYDTEGTHLFLDDVHLYPNWADEVVQLQDTCPGLSITFAVSALYTEQEIRQMLKREMACYRMDTMSFREFLDYESLMEIPAFSLQAILGDHMSVVVAIDAEISVDSVFRHYLEYGCYPFYWNDPDAYLFQIQQNIQTLIRRDFPIVTRAHPADTELIERLLLQVAATAPNCPPSAALAYKAGLNMEEVDYYMEYLHRAGVIRIPGLVHSETPAARCIYMGNPNLSAALFRENSSATEVAEMFFVDQLSRIARVERKENNDFLVEGRYSFMVGDTSRDYSRIYSEKNLFAAVYELPNNQLDQMPIWTLGLFY